MVVSGGLHCSCLLLVCSWLLTCCVTADWLLVVRSGSGLGAVVALGPVSKSIHLTPNPKFALLALLCTELVQVRLYLY